MIRQKALRKILLTTITFFILLFISVFPKSTENSIKTNLEVEYITGLGTNTIYLLNKDNYLVKSKILLDSSKKEEQVKKIISNLTISDNSIFPNGLKAIIPANTKLLGLNYEDDVVTLNFSKEFFNINKDLSTQLISALVFSITSLNDIDGITLQVEGKELTTYPNKNLELDKVLTKDIGINKIVNITSFNNIQKIVLYYVNKVNNDEYYVPVTKYLNDDRDKIQIIIDELTTSYIYEPNLMSFLNNNLKLINYEKKENVLFLNFNNLLCDKNNKIIKEVKYSLAYSIFDNYNVKEVVLEQEGKEVENILKEKLP